MVHEYQLGPWNCHKLFYQRLVKQNLKTIKIFSAVCMALSMTWELWGGGSRGTGVSTCRQWCPPGWCCELCDVAGFVCIPCSITPLYVLTTLHAHPPRRWQIGLLSQLLDTWTSNYRLSSSIMTLRWTHLQFTQYSKQMSSAQLSNPPVLRTNCAVYSCVTLYHPIAVMA